MRIMVVGGAGYIGSHMVLALVETGHDVLVLDDLSKGHADAVQGVPLVKGSIADSTLLDDLFGRMNFDGVMHFASFIQVAESILEPAPYYENNLVNTIILLNAMVRHKIKKLVFSSSAAVYGEPQVIPITEDHPKNPVNPYGKGKWMVEQILQDYERAYDLKSISLRYFNAAGADPLGRAGERHLPETHLIPLLLKAAAGKADPVTIFGTDYDTADGSCIRDYIHVTDLCVAHLLAFQALMSGAPGSAYNLGNGHGFSVWEVLEAVKRVTGKPVPFQIVARRAGDPSHLVADATRAQVELGWQPHYPALDSIISHAWNFACMQQ
ncbi:MAG: UDP-glucose 4-epimerase GalE [Pseudomonadota bacterium]|nr:UDP-glucose 4-epimerase GalE [Pseudomonadota bacterium]